jgi:hypothetical protein
MPRCELDSRDSRLQVDLDDTRIWIDVDRGAQFETGVPSFRLIAVRRGVSSGQ